MASITISIPGKWESQNKIIQDLTFNNKGFFMDELYMSKCDGSALAEVVIDPYDESLTSFIEMTKSNDFSEKILEDIQHHTYIVSLTMEIEEIKDILTLVEMGSSLLKAGGLAVIVETAIKTYSKESWENLLHYTNLNSEKDIYSLYSNFVHFIEENQFYCSYGMKTFGLPDVVIQVEMPFYEVGHVLNYFNLYQIHKNPTLRTGHTFSLEGDSNIYQMERLVDFRCEVDDYLYNPYGVWILTKKISN